MIQGGRVWRTKENDCELITGGSIAKQEDEVRGEVVRA